MNDCDRIMDYLQKHGEITVRQIQSELMINVATARLSDLMHLGQVYKARMEVTAKGKLYAVYKLTEVSV